MKIFDVKRLFDRADDYLAGLLRGAGISFLLRIAGAGAAFLFNIILARKLGADAVGLYFLALTQITMVAMVARLGLDSVLLRATAVQASRGDWSAVSGGARTGLRLVLFSSIMLAVTLSQLAPWLSLHAFAKPDLAITLRWMTIAIPPLAMAFVYGELLKALSQIVRSQLVQVVLPPALAIPVFLIFASAWGAWAAIFSYCLGVLAAAMLAALFWQRAVSGMGRATSVSARALLSEGLPLMWMQLLVQAISWVDVLILGMFRPAAEVALYAVASRLAMLTSFAIMAVNNVAGPRFAALYSQGDLAGLAQVAVRSSRLTLLVSAPLLAIFVLAPHWVLALFGHDFSAASTVLIVLAIGQFFNVVTGSVGQILIMTGHGRALRNLSALNFVLCVALNLLLIPLYGAIGAAVASALSGTVLNILGNFAVYRYHGIQVHLLAKCEPGSQEITA